MKQSLCWNWTDSELWDFEVEIRGQNIDFKEFAIEIVTFGIKILHECRPDPYSNLQRNNLTQLKHFKMLPTNWLVFFPKNLMPGFITFD